MRVRLTREGLRFGALLVIVGFAAYNTGNNLIFLMLSVGIATLAVTFVSGLLSAGALSVEAGAIRDVYAGTPFSERLRIRNGSSLLDAFGIAVDGGAGVGFLKRGSAAGCAVTRVFPRRGVHPGAPVTLSTRFPLGLFRFERRSEAPRRILVYPQTRPVDPAALALADGAGMGAGGRPGRGDELFRLRDYEAGDPVHHIHWKTTAKVGRLIVRDLGDAREDRLTLSYWPAVAAGAPPSFERVVVATASIARHLVESGTSFRFIAPEIELPARSGREHLRAVLGHLAVACPLEGAPAGFRARLQRARASGEIVLLVAPEGAAPGGLSEAGLRLVTPERVLSGERAA